MKRAVIVSVIGICVVLGMYFAAAQYPEGNAAVQHQAVFWVGEKAYLSNGEKLVIDVAPFIENGRVYVPVRFLGNALDVPEDRIDWNGETQTVTFNTENEIVTFTVGDSKMTVNSEQRAMDVVPLSMNNRVFIPARWLTDAMGYEIGWDESAKAVLIGPPGNLPVLPDRDDSLAVVGSYENLVSLLADLVQYSGYYYAEDEVALSVESIANDSIAGAMDTPKLSAPMRESAMDDQADADQGVNYSAAESGAGADYSQTNVQVAGVDEADIVKTDGKYIYLVKGSQVIVAEAYPAGEMKIISRMDYTGKNFIPQEMYVDGKNLIIIGGTGYDYKIMPTGAVMDVAPVDGARAYPAYNQRNMVKAIVCDATDKTAIKQVRELELEGYYVSSRKIGSALYLLSNRYINYYPGNPASQVENPQPLYRDSVAGEDAYVDIDYGRINCIPGFVQPNYLLVAGIDLNKPEQNAEVNAYLGAGENIYASARNLYVAVTGYQYDEVRLGYRPINTSQTKVYKFALNGGKVSYSAAGEAPGVILNQFSMDEYKGIFRIATTSGEIWRSGENTSKNNVYNLDEGMNIIGRLEGIAPGERIYSVRFMGDRGYMVTFKTVDPFFVIDLKDPAAPKVLGALKIPGYSDYMHPYDDNHIIGFGKETIELGPKGGGNSTAYYTGMKMAVFDVTDVSNPVEMFKEKIGGRGTESPLLHNHKALLFSKEKNLLALPITLMEVKGPEVVDGFPVYGEFTYQGAYVYNLNLTDGFQLKGRITHLSDQDYQMAGSYWYDSDKNVERILYINDVLYTLSGRYIKANSLNDLADISALDLN